MKIPDWFKLKPAVEFVEQPTHTHEWIHKLITYAVPVRDMGFLSHEPSDTIEKGMFGLTTVLEDCAICHDTRSIQMLGTDRPQLDEMLDRVELYGSQFLQRNNITFVFQKYQPPVQQAAGLPLR